MGWLVGEVGSRAARIDVELERAGALIVAMRTGSSLGALERDPILPER